MRTMKIFIETFDYDVGRTNWMFQDDRSVSFPNINTIDNM